MIGDIMQPTHLLFVLVIALLVLGPKRLPEVGRQLGKGLRDFRAAINGEQMDEHDTLGANGHASQPYQAPPPVDHQFAHETTESVSSQDPSGDDTAAESAANGHQIGDPPAEPVAGDHQFAHEAPPESPAQPADPGASEPSPEAEASGHQAETATSERPADAGASGTAGEHEFAYESARPADKPVDPLT
jgi:sec-independent protein translocase protein TatA